MGSIAQFVPNKPNIAINLNLLDDGTISVRSCEVLRRGVRNRISFQTVLELRDVFVSDLADTIEACIGGISNGTGVLSLPDIHIELPGLTLSGIHLLISKARNKTKGLILRFKHFLGNMDAAFLEKFRSTSPVEENRNQIATELLADIGLPLLNLSKTKNFSSPKTVTGFLGRLDLHARELEFRMELLKRFINEPNNGANTPKLKSIHKGTLDGHNRSACAANLSDQSNSPLNLGIKIRGSANG